MARSRVVFPDPDGPTMPTKSPALTDEGGVDDDGVAVVGAGHIVEPDQRPGRRRVLGRRTAGGHCGYSASSGAVGVSGTASRAAASPPSASIIVM